MDLYPSGTCYMHVIRNVIFSTTCALGQELKSVWTDFPSVAKLNYSTNANVLTNGDARHMFWCPDLCQLQGEVIMCLAMLIFLGRSVVVLLGHCCYSSFRAPNLVREAAGPEAMCKLWQVSDPVVPPHICS